MSVVPADTAVTNPVALTVPIVGFEDTHGELEAAVPEPDNCDIELTQTDKVPVTVGKAFTVKMEVTVQLFEFL